MPGLFYHFLCLMRSWGLDLAAPPMLGIYPTTLSTALLTETAPQLVAALSLYLLSYEFVYYWCGPPSTAERHPMPAPRSAPALHPRRTLAALSLHPRCTLSAGGTGRCTRSLCSTSGSTSTTTSRPTLTAPPSTPSTRDASSRR